LFENEIYVVRLHGECDALNYPEFRTAFSSVPSTALRILVDCSTVTLVDSTFLTELLLVKRRWDREGRRSAVLLHNEQARRVMIVGNVIDRLDVFADRETAVHYLRGNPSLEPS